MKLTKNTRRALSVDTSTSFSDGYVELTEWSNGDGWTMEVDSDNSLGRRLVDLSYGELEALHVVLAEIFE